MMLTGLQTSSKTLPLDGALGKSQSVDSETTQPVSFGEVLKLKEKQLQQEQEVNPASVAAALAVLQTMSLATQLPLPQIETIETNGTTIAKAESNQSALDIIPQISTPSTGISDAIASTPLTAARLTPTESADPVSPTFPNAVSASLAQPVASQTESPKAQLSQSETAKTQLSPVATSTKVDNAAFINQNFDATTTKPAQTIKQDVPSTIPSSSNEVTSYAAPQFESTRQQALQVEIVKQQASPEIISNKVDSPPSQNPTVNVTKIDPAIQPRLTIPNAAETMASPVIIQKETFSAAANTSQVAVTPPSTLNATVGHEQETSTTEVQTDSQQLKSPASVFIPQEKDVKAFQQNHSIGKLNAHVVIEEENKSIPSEVYSTYTGTQLAPVEDSAAPLTNQPASQQIERAGANSDPRPETLASSKTASPSFAQTTNQVESDVQQPADETLLAQNSSQETTARRESLVSNIPLKHATVSKPGQQINTNKVELHEKPVEVHADQTSDPIRDLNATHDTNEISNNVPVQVSTLHFDKSESQPAQIQNGQIPVAETVINELEPDKVAKSTANPTSASARVTASQAEIADESPVAQVEVLNEAVDHETSTATKNNAISRDPKPAETLTQVTVSQPTETTVVFDQDDTSGKITSQTVKQPETANPYASDVSTSRLVDLAQNSADSKPVEIKSVSTQSMSTAATVEVQIQEKLISDQNTVGTSVENSEKLIEQPVVSSETMWESPDNISDASKNKPSPELVTKSESDVTTDTSLSTTHPPVVPAPSMPTNSVVMEPSELVNEDAAFSKNSVPIFRNLPELSSIPANETTTQHTNNLVQVKTDVQTFITSTVITPASTTQDTEVRPVITSNSDVDAQTEIVSQVTIASELTANRVAALSVNSSTTETGSVVEHAKDPTLNITNISDTVVTSDVDQATDDFKFEQGNVQEPVVREAKPPVQNTTNVSEKVVAAEDMHQTAVKPLVQPKNVETKVPSETPQPTTTNINIPAGHESDTVHESNDLETATLVTKSNSEIKFENPVVAAFPQDEKSAKADIQPNAIAKPVEQESLTANEQVLPAEPFIQSSKTPVSFADSVDVKESASTTVHSISQVVASETQKLDDGQVFAANMPVQTNTEPLPLDNESHKVDTLQPSMKQSNSVSFVAPEQPLSVAKAETEVEIKPATAFQAVAQTLKADQEKAEVESKPQTEQPEPVSLSAPATISSDTEPAPAAETLVTASSAEPQLQHVETTAGDTDTVAKPQEFVSQPTEIKQNNQTVPANLTGDSVRADVTATANSVLSHDDIEHDPSTNAEPEQVISFVETTTRESNQISSSAEKIVAPLDTTIERDHHDSKLKVSVVEHESSKAANHTQTRTLDQIDNSEKMVETSNQLQPEPLVTSNDKTSESENGPQQTKAGTTVSQPMLGVETVENNKINNEADVKISEVKASAVESKEKPNTKFNSVVNKPEVVINEIPASAPPRDNEVMPVASKPNVSAVRDTIKVKQAGKDEETAPVGKEPKLNQMPEAVTAATGPNKEAVAVDRSGDLPSTPTNAQAVDVAQQVIRHLTSNLKTGSTAMRLQLNPKELGAIDIQMVSNAQGVHVTFAAEQTNTSKLLEMQLPQLRESLMDAGVQLSGLNISQHNQSGQKGGGFSQEPKAAPWSNEIVVEENQAGMTETSATERRFRQSSEVDYLI